MTNAYPRFHFPPLRQRTTTTLEGPQPISEQDRETIFGQAKAEGFQQGFTEGRAEGLEQGLKEGRAQGITEGQAQGLAESQELFTRASAPWTLRSHNLTPCMPMRNSSRPVPHWLWSAALPGW